MTKSAVFAGIAMMLGVPWVHSAELELVLDSQTKGSATVYELSLKKVEESRVIWTKVVPYINGRAPYEWRRIVAWDANEHGAIILLEVNQSTVNILQFTSDFSLSKDVVFFDHRDWLRSERSGYRVRGIAPDKILVDGKDSTKTMSWRLAGQTLIDDAGVAGRFSPSLSRNAAGEWVHQDLTGPPVRVPIENHLGNRETKDVGRSIAPDVYKGARLMPVGLILAAGLGFGAALWWILKRKV